MGMHFGLIVFRGSHPALADVFATRHARLVDLGQPIRVDDLPRDDENGFPCALSSRGGHTVFHDGSMIVSGDIDLIVELSAHTESTVAAFEAETASGTFEFTAARSGQLLRAHAHCHMSQSEPWEYGSPLKCERNHPFNGDLRGTGFFAAIDELGFGDLRKAIDGTWIPCTLDIDFNAWEPAKSNVAKVRDEFCRAHQLSKSPPLKVVVSTPSTSDAGLTARRNESMLRRLLRLFRR